MENALWEREEFEDIITRAIIGLYDSENLTKKEGFKRVKECRVTESDIMQARKIGCYFCPEDRLTLALAVDLENDGLPKYAAHANPDEHVCTEEDFRDYISFQFAKKIKRLPGGFRCFGHHAYYELINWAPQAKGGAYLTKELLGIDNNGLIHYASSGNMIDHGREWKTKVRVMLAATLNYWADKRFLWNVEVKEAEAKATFGVYQEQIQSLFYARDLPLTVTGRKRPILHWVKSHRRRMKSGTEIDIEKHLRGITEFDMNGTMFKITRPYKKEAL